MFKNKLAKGAIIVGSLALAGVANAQGVGDVSAAVDLGEAKAAIIAIGVGLGGFYAVGIGIRAVLRMMARF